MEIGKTEKWEVGRVAVGLSREGRARKGSG